jgi:DNA-directed RNA polymerase subunit RPC12/RpoP
MDTHVADEERELKYLNSEGHIEVSVTCAKCGKKFSTMIEAVRKNEALKNDSFFCEDCSGIRIFSFEVDGLPPMKDGAKSMWDKPHMAERLKKLRYAAKEALKGYFLTHDITLIVDINCSQQEKSIGDLDNFITGICDGLQIANTTPQYIHSILKDNPDIDPLKVRFIENDSKIVKINATINKNAEKTKYFIELYDEE